YRWVITPWKPGVVARAPLNAYPEQSVIPRDTPRHCSIRAAFRTSRFLRSTIGRNDWPSPPHWKPTASATVEAMSTFWTSASLVNARLAGSAAGYLTTIGTLTDSSH